MSNSIKNLVRKNILSLNAYTSARDEYTNTEGVFLDANENPFGTYNRYPDPYQIALKTKLAELKNCNADNVFIGNGSDELIDLTFRIFCEPGVDTALTFTPTYGMYEVSAGINNIELIKIPLNDSLQINKAQLTPHLTNTQLKLIIICSPNNPTGNHINREDILFILSHFDGIILIDEAYIDFSEQPSFINDLKKYQNLIIIQTLSKAWGLAGIRIGMAYMNTELTSYFNKVKPPYNVSTINQQTALNRLLQMDDYKRDLQIINLEKERLFNTLTSLSFIKKIYPSDTNFFLVEVSHAIELYNKLIEQHIVVRNRHSIINNCLRITVGSPTENTKLIHALTQLNDEQ